MNYTKEGWFEERRKEMMSSQEAAVNIMIEDYESLIRRFESDIKRLERMNWLQKLWFSYRSATSYGEHLNSCYILKKRFKARIKHEKSDFNKRITEFA